MKKIERAILRETVYTACWVLILSLLMQAVFLLLGKWGWTVLTGNLLGAAVAVLNFFLLGLGVQKAAAKEDPKEAKQVIQVSYGARLLLVGVLAVVGVALPWFHSIAAVVPLLFPQIAMLFRPRFGGMDKEGGA